MVTGKTAGWLSEEGAPEAVDALWEPQAVMATTPRRWSRGLG
jgi:hypothetical protein